MVFRLWLRLLWETKARWPLWLLGALSIGLLFAPGVFLCAAGKRMMGLSDALGDALRQWTDKNAPPTRAARKIVREIERVEHDLALADRMDRDAERALVEPHNECN